MVGGSGVCRQLETRDKLCFDMDGRAECLQDTEVSEKEGEWLAGEVDDGVLGNVMTRILR